MKTHVIVIAGSKTKNFPLVAPLLDRFYAHYEVEQNDDPWEEDLAEYIQKNSDFSTEVFYWSGGISRRLSVYPAAKKLAVYIAQEQHKYGRIVLFGKSMGGLLAEECTRILGCPESIELISAATPRTVFDMRKPVPASFTHIFSLDDTYHALANRTICFGFGRFTHKKAKNIPLPDLTHSKFNKNIEVMYKGVAKPLYEIYLECMQKEEKV